MYKKKYIQFNLQIQQFNEFRWILGVAGFIFEEKTTNMKKMPLLTLIFLMCTTALLAQDNSLLQTIKGTVIDKQAQYPLFGVNIILLESEEFVGTTTNIDGHFKLENIPIGRQSIKLSYIGYDDVVLSNILVSSAKEVDLNVAMEENVSALEEVVVKASKDKHQAINELATVSARTISIEEMSRFSGSTQDPARMAQSYAGVSGASDDRNDIIVRGNSPTGVLWRMEGVDIPSPNHFAALGTTGGPIGMLNINNLKNSDFLSSAFPAEYGNATSAVFDLKLRNGNIDKHEFLGQVGLNGFELGAEGPLSVGKNASFLANYRYSTLGVLHAMGIQFGTGFAVPQYQDLTFKVNLPTEKSGIFSLWGLGGMSYIEFKADENGEDNLFNDDTENSRFESNTGVVGLSHLYFFNAQTFSKLTLSASGTQSKGHVEFLQEDGTFEHVFGQDYRQMRYTLNWKFNKKINTKNRFTAGAIYELHDIQAEDSVRIEDDSFIPDVNFDGNTDLIQMYAQWQHRFNDKLTLNSGIHAQYLTLNDSKSLEPRIGLKYEPTKRHTFSVGGGLHSQMQPVLIYFLEDEVPSNTLSNESLDFVRSTHAVVSWDYLLNPNMRIKLEGYHQYLYNVAVDSFASSFSMLNTGADFGFPDRLNLVNEGTGSNYGIELTLEKFFSQQYYFLFTTSLFNSQYKGSDGVLRNTLFNSNYVFNLLGGKEFKLSDKFSLTLDSKITYSGGRRYTPIDVNASIQAGDEILVEGEAFTNQYDSYFRTDLKIGFRHNAEKFSQTFSIDLQNVTNQKNIFIQEFNEKSGTIETTYQRGFFPDVRYQILF